MHMYIIIFLSLYLGIKKITSHPISLTVETQSPQLSVACQIIIGHHSDVVEGEI